MDFLRVQTICVKIGIFGDINQLYWRKCYFVCFNIDTNDHTGEILHAATSAKIDTAVEVGQLGIKK